MQACGETWCVDDYLLLVHLLQLGLLNLGQFCQAGLLLQCRIGAGCDLPLLLDVRCGCGFRCFL